MILSPDFDYRFKNWVRWCLARSGSRHQAGSVEGNYRSGQIWDVVEARDDGEIDSVDAELVNSAYCRLAAVPRQAIKVLYFRVSWRPQWQAQKLQCRVVDLPRVGLQARLLLAAQVDMLSRSCHSPRTVNAVRVPMGAAFA